jgi:hypothetical protein
MGCANGRDAKRKKKSDPATDRPLAACERRIREML